jgi:hypothetical protein
MSDIDPNMLQGPDDPQPGHFKPEVEKTLPVEMKLKHFDKLTDFHEQIHLKRYTIPTLRVRDPNEPLSGPEKAVFGESARRHEITGYPIEQGMTDHSPGGGNARPTLSRKIGTALITNLLLIMLRRLRRS